MLYGEQMKKILEKSGFDTSTLPDNLYSTLLEAIYNADVAQEVVWVDNASGSLESVYASNRYYSTLSDFIKEITIPNGVTGIGNYAFKNCSSLESVTIPESVKSIGFDAFQYCSSLTSITIPVSITDINQYAFADCTNLANIYYKGTEEQWNSIVKGTRWNLNMGRNVSGGTVIHYNS